MFVALRLDAVGGVRSEQMGNIGALRVAPIEHFDAPGWGASKYGALATVTAPRRPRFALGANTSAAAARPKCSGPLRSIKLARLRGR